MASSSKARTYSTLTLLLLLLYSTLLLHCLDCRESSPLCGPSLRVASASALYIVASSSSCVAPCCVASPSPYVARLLRIASVRGPLLRMSCAFALCIVASPTPVLSRVLFPAWPLSGYSLVVPAVCVALFVYSCSYCCV